MSETKTLQPILPGSEVGIRTAVLLGVSAVPSHALANRLVVGGVAEGVHAAALVSAGFLARLADGVAVLVVSALVVAVATSYRSDWFAVSADV